MFNKKIIIAGLIFVCSLTSAQMSQFKAGETLPEYGKIASVPGMEPLPENATFKISFDVAKPAKSGEINRSLDSTARFINMHTASGVKAEDINLAVVVHGGAVKDMTVDAFYAAEHQKTNKNAGLIKALQQNGVTFYVCGQSAAYYGVKKADLLPGVKLSLSAMTAHALLQQQGHTLNPF